MSITPEDLAPLLAELGRFASGRIAPACTRPHEAMSVQTLSALSDEAVALGILPAGTADGDDGSLALWQHRDSATAMAFNLQALACVAEVNAGVAWAWHRHALAHTLCRRLGLGMETADAAPLRLALVTGGHYGMGRAALARWLHGRPLQAGDADFLHDWLDRRANLTPLYAASGWTQILWPLWHGGTVVWQRVRRDTLQVQACAAQHGLDEICANVIAAAGTATETAVDGGGDGREVLREVLLMDHLGCLAIAAGALPRCQRLARDYARLRVQGGSVIALHPAVHQMLAEIEVVRLLAHAALAQFHRPLAEIDLGEVVASRVAMHPRLRHAANQALQVHGGIGYMRDTGAEKGVRDQNLLALLGGGQREGLAFLAGWTGDCP